MKTLMEKIVAAACLMAGLSAFATDYTWSSTATATKEWQALANWKVGGEAATDLPTNATDTAAFPAIDTTMRTVNLMAAQDDWKGSLASVTGNEYWRLRFNTKGATGGDYTETFAFGDVNGFTGTWQATGGKKTLQLTAASGTQTLTTVAVAGQFSIDVVNAGVTADIKRLTGTSGSLKKSGAGDLRVRDVADAGNLVLELEQGNVQLDGKMKTAVLAQDDHNDFDVANASDGTSITVPEGRVARIGTLRATGTTFTKKGAGTLQVGRVYPEDLTIAVEGGEVKLDTEIRTGEPSAPTGTPQLWLDANAANAFTKDGDNVTAWKDCRDNGKQATKLELSKITAYPTVDTTRVSGKTTLTFPASSAFQMPLGEGSRETFVAFCYTGDPGYYNFIGEGYKTDRRMKVSNVYQYYMFAAPNVGYELMAGGTFSLDGKPVRPYEWTGTQPSPGTTFVKGQWYVAHLSTTALAGLSRLASEGPRNCTGNVSYGEVITYDTALSPEDRAANIDYLMRKWLGKRHPEYAAPAKDISLAFSGADAAIGSDGDATYAEVTGSGALRKTGSGDVTVTAELTDDFNSLAVEGGSLTISKMVAPPDRSQFHFDAMDTASYATTYKDADGNTRVSKWADTRANGVYAKYIPRYVPSGKNFFNPTNPVLRQVTCADGVERPMLDFLSNMGRNVEPPTGAALAVSPAPATTREVHCVMANNSGAVDVFGTTDSNTDQFKRGSGGTLFHNNAAADVKNGYLSVNNQPATMSTYVGGADNKLYLVSMSPANGSSYNMGALAYRGSNFTTGMRYGEYIAFTEPLPAKERAYLQGKLMHKWINSDLPDAVWTNEFTSVALGSGATLTVDGGAISAPTITGGGTIDAAKVMGIETLNLTATGPKAIAGLTVEGEADFAGPVTVNLAGGANLRSGTYPLVSATSLANVDLSQWTLNGAPTKYAWRLERHGNAVVLDVKKRGLCVIIK